MTYFSEHESHVVIGMEKSSQSSQDYRSTRERRRRYLAMRFLRLRRKPKEMARGLAVGVFAGCFPLFGLQTLIGILLAILVRGNKFAAAAGTWISNPFTYVPLFMFNYKIGKLLLGSHELGIEDNLELQDLQSWSTLADLGGDFLQKLFLGCFLVGSIASCLTYFYVLGFIRRWQYSPKNHRPKCRLKSKR